MYDFEGTSQQSEPKNLPVLTEVIKILSNLPVSYIVGFDFRELEKLL